MYTFPLGDLNPILENVKHDLLPIGLWCTAWSMKFPAHKSSMPVQKCQEPTRIFKINQEVIPSPNTVRDLGLHYFSTFKFSEDTQIKVAKARRIIVLVNRIFRTMESKLLVYKQVRPILNYSSIVSSNVQKSDRLEL